MLGSDRDGEVVAAAAALRRTLAGAGLDLHDLAAAVERPTAQAAEWKRPAARKPKKARAARPRAAEPPPPPTSPPRADLVELSPDARAALVEGLAEAVEDARAALTEWERAFARDLFDMVGRRRLRPTERQLAQAQRISLKARGAAT